MSLRERIVFGLGVSGYSGVLVLALHLAGFSVSSLTAVVVACVFACVVTLGVSLGICAARSDQAEIATEQA